MWRKIFTVRKGKILLPYKEAIFHQYENTEFFAFSKNIKLMLRKHFSLYFIIAVETTVDIAIEILLDLLLEKILKLLFKLLFNVLLKLQLKILLNFPLNFYYSKRH